MQNHSYWGSDNHNVITRSKEIKDHPHHTEQVKYTTRGSLGQFIERSTSAPPLSVLSNTDDDTVQLLDNHLYEYVSKGYNDSIPSLGTDHSRHRNELNSNALDKVLLSNIGVIDDSGRSTAPTTNTQYTDFSYQMAGTGRGITNSASPCTPIGEGRSVSISSNSSSGYAMSRPLSASGDGALYHDFLDANSDFGGIGLQRSQSAAPRYSMVPPPGLSLHQTSQSDTFTSHLGVRRPASAGVSINYTGSGTVRPAAKTLMDLIQEDMPPDYEQKRSTPSISASSIPGEVSAVLHEQPDYQSVSVGLKETDFKSQSRLNAFQGQTQQEHLKSVHAPFHESLNIRQVQKHSTVDDSQPVMLIQQHRQNLGYNQEISDDPLQSSLYIQQQLPQQHLHMHGHHQQLYYGGQQIGGIQTGMQQPGMNGNSLQGQVLTNGQTLYVNAGPSQQNYGYSTVQYQSAHQQQPQIMHHQISSGQREQYVSVLPIQSSGSQVSYWQPNGMMQQQQMIFPAQGLVALGSQMTTTNTDSSLNYNVGNRTRDKASRGRRGTGPRGRIGDVKSVVPTSSALLEEFRSAKSRDWTMRRIEGYVVEFCQDQSGSRFIQQRLEMGDHVEQQIVMKEVLPAIRRLRNDVFGNYVVQKLLDFGTSKMKSEIRDTLEGEMLPLSLLMYGCRVVQKAIEALEEEDLPRLLREFQSDVLSCIHDQNGNHVIQKCIEVLNSRASKAESVGDVHRATFLREQIDFIFDDVLANATALACHPYGCRVLQRILEHCTENKKAIILREIKRCHKALLDDQYGNYVIQHVLQYGRDEDRDSIVQIVVDCGLLGLARQKFASNVVEKLLKYGNGDQRRAVVREMLKKADDPTVPSEPGDGDTVVVLLMVRDAYANYVVQTTLDVIPESEEKRLLLEELNAHADELRNYTFAKHIVAKLASISGGN